MARTKYRQAEEAFDEAWHKMHVNALLKIADEKTEAPLADKQAVLPQEAPSILATERTQLYTYLKNEIKNLEKKDPDLYIKLGENKNKMKKIIEGLKNETEDLGQALVLKNKIEIYKKNLPVQSNQEIIEEQKKNHKVKRFNVNKNWLPLH